jgi:hypothetical protein
MSNQGDCLFCEEGSPCAVHAGKEKKLPKLKPTGSAPSVSIPSPIPTTSEPTSTDWLPAPRKSRFQEIADQPVDDTEDARLRQVLHLFEDMLSKGTLAKYKHIMYPKKDAYLFKLGAEVRRSLDGRTMEPPQAGND